tara:strand:+ start:78 stop:287 length:210 start_codon:yes stop_codon:yes gene_type:complete
MRQKLITLDPTTFELATKKGNFSMWVRQQLNLESVWANQLAIAQDDSLYWKEQHDKLRAILIELRGVKE